MLNKISLKLYEGETLGIIGRIGVGKTAMLRVMADILAPGSGEVITRPGATSSLLTIGLGFKGDLTGRDNAMLSAMLPGATREKALTFLEGIKEFSVWAIPLRNQRKHTPPECAWVLPPP